MPNLTIVRNDPTSSTSVLSLPIQQHNAKSVMSSVDLAKMCVPALTKSGKENKEQHSDFMKKAKQVLGEGIGNFSDTYIHPQNGQPYPYLLLPEREACLMAMSYSYELQAKVYDAWQALRNTNVQPQHVIPQSYGQALRLAAEQTIKVEQQEVIILEHKQQATINAPKVTVTEAAKVIGFAKNGDLKKCIQKKWLCLNGEAMQHGIKAGFFVVRAHEWGSTTYMTPKGIIHFAQLAYQKVPHLMTLNKQAELMQHKEVIIIKN